MITEKNVQKTPEECCRHLLFEVVMTACNDWLAFRDRGWASAEKRKYPQANHILELQQFFAGGGLDRILHMIGSTLSAERILIALKGKKKDDFACIKHSDKVSEMNVSQGKEEEARTCGVRERWTVESIMRACDRWLKKREDGYEKKKPWNALDFRQKTAKNKNQTKSK